MKALVLLLSLAAPCDAPGDERQLAICAYEAQPEPPPLEVSGLPAIYEREGFERARERNSGAAQALWAQARAWLLSLFETRGAETYSNVTRVAVLVAAIALAVLIVLRVRGRARAPEARPATFTATGLQLDDPAAHRARAEALLAGDPREAMREALFSLLATLERRRLARPDRTRTNRELGEDLPRSGAPPELVARVTPLFAWFDRTFYSLADVAPDEARRFLDDVRALTEQPS